MRSISRHITPLVVNSLGRGHIHTHAYIPTIRTGSILRNQARTWFKKKLNETRENLISIKLTTILYNTKSYNTIKHKHTL